MKKYAVVTFLFDDYDLLREPLVVDDNFDYYCLTDNPSLVSSVWKCVYMPQFDCEELNGIQKTYMSKYSFYKYIPSDYEYFITIDASIQILSELTSIISRFADNKVDIGLSIHSERMRYIDEYNVWERTRGLSHEYTEKFIKFAERNGIRLEDESGLIECTMKIYRNCDIVIEFIDKVYATLGEWNGFKDKNDQCYFTFLFSEYEDKMKVIWFYRQLYSNSKYFAAFLHKTNVRWITPFRIDTTNNMLYGKKRKLEEF